MRICFNKLIAEYKDDANPIDTRLKFSRRSSK